MKSGRFLIDSLSTGHCWSSICRLNLGHAPVTGSDIHALEILGFRDVLLQRGRSRDKNERRWQCPVDSALNNHQHASRVNTIKEEEKELKKTASKTTFLLFFLSFCLFEFSNSQIPADVLHDDDNSSATNDGNNKLTG